MRWLENLIGLYLGHAVILEVWQWMEVQMYGEVQVRDVDTVVTLLYLAFVMIAYLKGRCDGHNDKEESKHQ